MKIGGISIVLILGMINFLLLLFQLSSGMRWIKVTVTHSANSVFHYTEWLWVQVNGKEVARWDFGSKKPEDATFTREIKVKVDGDLEIKAKANCNMHGSANEATAKVTAK